jgi:hypothetical protein
MPILIVASWVCWLTFVSCLASFIWSGSLVALVAAGVAGYFSYRATVAIIEYK